VAYMPGIFEQVPCIQWHQPSSSVNTECYQANLRSDAATSSDNSSQPKQVTDRTASAAYRVLRQVKATVECHHNSCCILSIIGQASRCRAERLDGSSKHLFRHT
jgi:hypothetical protein